MLVCVAIYVHLYYLIYILMFFTYILLYYFFEIEQPIMLLNLILLVPLFCVIARNMKYGFSTLNL